MFVSCRFSVLARIRPGRHSAAAIATTSKLEEFKTGLEPSFISTTEEPRTGPTHTRENQDRTGPEPKVQFDGSGTELFSIPSTDMAEGWVG